MISDITKAWSEAKARAEAIEAEALEQLDAAAQAVCARHGFEFDWGMGTYLITRQSDGARVECNASHASDYRGNANGVMYAQRGETLYHDEDGEEPETAPDEIVELIEALNRIDFECGFVR